MIPWVSIFCSLLHLPSSSSLPSSVLPFFSSVYEIPQQENLNRSNQIQEISSYRLISQNQLELVTSNIIFLDFFINFFFLCEQFLQVIYLLLCSICVLHMFLVLSLSFCFLSDNLVIFFCEESNGEKRAEM